MTIRDHNFAAPAPLAQERRPRVAIVADSASARFGGEAVLPLHYFQGLRRRGVEVHLVVHERTASELRELLRDDLSGVHFIRETLAHRALWLIGRPLPHRLAYFTFGLLSRLLTQHRARRIVRRLVADGRIDVVHQPVPVSPLEPSLLHGLGVPVVIGPLNGGMTCPPGMAKGGGLCRLAEGTGRITARVLHRLLPGKLRADVILVANDRTRRALPVGIRGHVQTLVENGIVPREWPASPRRRSGAPHFVFVGRLVKWKAVELLLEAFAPVARATGATLDVVGDGPERAALEHQARQLTPDGRVRFCGWLRQQDIARTISRSDALVLPSLVECGGAVVLEAMACGRAVIATRWGGPADYLDETCGILVEPRSRQQFVSGLTEAMLKLANEPERCAALGAAGHERVIRQYDWDAKIERMLATYQAALARSTASRGHAPAAPAVMPAEEVQAFDDLDEPEALETEYA